MNVSAWSIKNPIPAILLFILLSFAGLIAFRAMKIQHLPDVEVPVIVITASLPGAAPSQMETEIARKIENAVASTPGIKHMMSLVQDGMAVISVEFRLEKPLQEALDDVRDAVSRIRADLPGEMQNPVISKSDIAGSPILTYAIASDRLDDEALSWFVDNDVTKAILSVKGVGKVSRVGGATRQIRVEIDPDKLLSLKITAADISRRLRQIQQEASGGRTDFGVLEQSVRTIATVKSAEELAKIEITLPDGRHIRLDQIARVEDGVAEKRSQAYFDGKPVVAFEVVRTKGAGEVNIMAGVRAELLKIKEKHPDIHIDEAFNFVNPVVENYEGSMRLLYEGALLAILVVWFFLRDGRATFVSAMALPLSIIPTFAVIYLMGFTINVVTLLSLSLVVGILVDDAIVEIENIIRHLSMGKSPYQAAMEAADEIGLAVIATTFALIAVFLPTAFMTGIVGRFFVQFGWTAAVSVFFSLVVARMLTPMMAAYLLKPVTHVREAATWEKIYMKMVAWCLANRKKTFWSAFVFFVAVLFGLMPLLPTGFAPPDDLSQTQVSLSLPPGSTFSQTEEKVKQAESIVRAHPQVKNIYTTIGGGASGSNVFEPQGASSPRNATLTISLAPRGERQGIKKQAIEAAFREHLSVLAGVRVKVGLGGAMASKYQIALTSEEGDALIPHALKVVRELREIQGIGAVTSSSSLLRPELVIRPDFARAADLGVTATAIAETLRIASVGDYDQFLPKLNLSQRQIPIVVKLEDAARKDEALISRLMVPGAKGPVMLSNFATIETGGGPAQIDRYDRSRTVNIEVELNGVPLGEVESKADALPSLKNMPAGMHKVAVGDVEAMGELFEGFSIAMATGVLCIYIVLVLLFKDFVQPVTILAALVLSIPGAILALFVTHTALSMPAMLGVIMLMGVATKNSILLVEYAIKARNEWGMSRLEALLDAGRKRARPIVMTTVAMGAGMLPTATGIGTDPSFRAPMAIVVIGGLITSTFLSLLVVPVVFTYVDDARLFVLNRLKRRQDKPTLS